MIATTLNKIKAHNPCVSGWRTLLAHLGKTQADDEPLPLAVIVESNGLQDALWACRTLPEYDKEWRLFAVWCGRQVQHLMEDARSVTALDVAERYANGQATAEELTEAHRAAYAAPCAYDAAAYAAAYAADAAAYAADAAAYAAAYAYATDADAAHAAAAHAAAAHAADAAADAARKEMQDRQRMEFLRIVGQP